MLGWVIGALFLTLLPRYSGSVRISGMDLETLIAKQEITDVVYRYARGIDRLDFELVRSCYHPDAYDDHGAFKGSVDEFIEMCEGFLPRWTATMHFMGNVLVDEIDGDSARAETYAVAYHRREATVDRGQRRCVWYSLRRSF